MTWVSLDGVSSAGFPDLIIQNVARQIVPSIRDVYRDVPGRAGAWHLPEAPGDRSLSFDVAVVTDDPDDRRGAVRQVARWLWSEGRRKLIVSDEPDRFVWAKIATDSKAAERLALGTFPIDFRTAPYDEAVTPSTQTLASSGSIMVPTDEGIADELLPVIEVEATTALASGFSIDVDGVELVYGSPMTLGQVVTVNCVGATVTAGASIDSDLVGLFDGSDLAMTAVDGDFPTLRPGTNTVTLSAGIEASFAWRKRYV